MPQSFVVGYIYSETSLADPVLNITATRQIGALHADECFGGLCRCGQGFNTNTPRGRIEQRSEDRESSRYNRTCLVQ
jgi:hypothetical protein